MKPRLFKPQRRQRRGFTLLEAMVALTLMALIFTGTMDLCTMAARTTLKVNSQMSASLDSSIALQQVIETIREAQSFSLPNETPANGGSFVMPTGFTGANYSTTLSGENIYTAMEVAQSATAAVTVKDSGGNTIAVTPAAYNRDAASPSTLLIYRGDPNGTPDSNPSGSTVRNAGTYLWQCTVSGAGATSGLRALCKSISTAPNAVQFVRPYVGNPAQAQPFQVEVKITSGYYSLVNGSQTNEETNGSTVSQLSGKCVLMRDHAISVQSGGSNQNSTNNAFRFH